MSTPQIATIGSRLNKPWEIKYGIDPIDGSCPADEYLDGLSESIGDKMVAILDVVAGHPPPTFRGGGFWEAMHGSMKGFYELRIDEGRRAHHRLFCKQVRNGKDFGLGGPALFVISGMTKPYRTTFKESEYEVIRKLAKRMTSEVPWHFAK